jgi:hypothetical protein
MAKETLKQRDKRDLDLQLDTELKGTFPASDPLTITRFPYKKRSAKPSIGDNADGAPLRRSDDRTVSASNRENVLDRTSSRFTRKS